MKGLILIVPFAVVIINGYVGAAPTVHEITKRSTTDCKPAKNQDGAIYAMGAVIGLLLATLVSLLAYIYKLKHSKTAVLDDEIHIRDNNTTQKYERQLSTEMNEVTYLPDRSIDSKRLLSRQGSKLTILDYPDHSLSRPKQPEDMTTNTSTACTPLPDNHKEQIENICKAILSRAAKKEESNGLSDETKFLNETSEEPKNPFVQKSASSQFLDVAENIDTYPSPSLVKKLQKFPAFNKISAENISDIKINTSIRKVAANLGNSETSCDTEINEIKHKTDSETSNLNKSNKHDKLVESEGKDELDEVYDDLPKITRPVTLSEDHLDEVYDNPSSIPVAKKSPTITKHSDETEDDFYDSPPCNKPFYSDNEHIDDVYDNPKSIAPILDALLDDKSKLKSKRDNDTSDDEDYDLPRRHGRSITITEDATGYLLPLTDDKEACFNAFYSNAKTFNTNSN